MAITTTGSFVQANSGSSGGTATYTVANVGDLCVVAASTASATIYATACSGNNSMGAFSSTAVCTDSTENASTRIFWATAGATGTVTVTVTWNGSPGSTEIEGWCYTAGLGAGTTWTLDTSGTHVTVGGTTIAYPSLTAAGSGELYVGCAVADASGSAGSTTGYSYNIDTGFSNAFCYNLNCSGTQSPTANDATSGNKVSTGALLIASAGSSRAPTRPIVLPSMAAMHASIW